MTGRPRWPWIPAFPRAARVAAIGVVLVALGPPGVAQSPTVAPPLDARPLSNAEAPRYMRQLARQLRAVVKDTPVELARGRGDLLRIRIPADYLFGLDATQLNAAGPVRLDPLVTTLESADRTQLVVVGHTDTLGTKEFNSAFSLRRAAAVAEYLQRQGVAAARVDIRGAGEREPAERKEDSPAARQRNRRIEIEVRPFRPSRRAAS